MVKGILPLRIIGNSFEAPPFLKEGFGGDSMGYIIQNRIPPNLPLRKGGVMEIKKPPNWRFFYFQYISEQTYP